MEIIFKETYVDGKEESGSREVFTAGRKYDRGKDFALKMIDKKKAKEVKEDGGK
jgi:hypothetical protein